MNITMQSITDDPSVYFLAFNADVARFQIMTRDGFEKSIFLDDRIRADGRPAANAPFGQLVDGYRGPSAGERPIGWIFHVAQCGSTLLARALDHPGRSLVLREPVTLRQLGVMAGGDGSVREQDPAFNKKLDFTLAMLGKSWPGEDRVITKANVPVNLIAADIMARMPQMPAICLHFPLHRYVAAVMRTEGHVEWVERVYGELRLDESQYAAGHVPVNAAERTALLWFFQMKSFVQVIENHDNACSLDAGVLFDQSEEVVRAAASLFDVAMSEDELADMIEGELFASYSKNPALDYDAVVRIAREKEALERLAPEIAAATAWASAAAERHGLPDALPKPLIGGTVPLLSEA